MTLRVPPAHMRRAKRARYARLLLGAAAAAFVIYRMVAIFLR